MRLAPSRYTAQELAAKTGKSVTFVLQRLKLADLIPAAAKSFQKDEIATGHALLLARLSRGAQSGHRLVSALRSLVHISPISRRGADQQRRRARPAHRGAMAKDKLRQSQRVGRDSHGAPAHRLSNLPHAGMQRADLSRQRGGLPPSRSPGPIPLDLFPVRDVNCYA